MKQYQLLFTIIIASIFISCEKDCDETYSITGHFYDSSADTPYSNSSVRLYYVNEKAFKTDRWQITSLKTDAKGDFQTNYDCVLRADFIEAEYIIGNQHYITKQLPANQDYNELLLLPSQGTVKLYLHSDSAVGVNNNDTLFLAFHNPENGNYHNYDIDTVLYFENGLYDTYKIPTGRGLSLYYGRGSKNFDYRPWGNYFYGNTKSVSVESTGDPEVNEITIEY